MTKCKTGRRRPAATPGRTRWCPEAQGCGRLPLWGPFTALRFHGDDQARPTAGCKGVPHTSSSHLCLLLPRPEGCRSDGGFACCVSHVSTGSITCDARSQSRRRSRNTPAGPEAPAVSSSWRDARSRPCRQRHAQLQAASPGSCGHSTRAAVWAHPGGGSRSRGLLSPWTGNPKAVLPQQGANRAAPHPQSLCAWV